MNDKTRALTVSALFTALCLVSLYFASVWPTGQLGFAAVASLFVAAAVFEAGYVYGLFVYVAGSALGLLLLPTRAAPLLFVLFFGFYPVVKKFVESLRNKILQWVLKLLVFNAALTVIWVFLRALFFAFIDSALSIVVLYISGNIVFALFDYGFSKVICFYMDRVHRARGNRKE